LGGPNLKFAIATHSPLPLLPLFSPYKVEVLAFYILLPSKFSPPTFHPPDTTLAKIHGTFSETKSGLDPTIHGDLTIFK